jgi:hypothetical protein
MKEEDVNKRKSDTAMKIKVLRVAEQNGILPNRRLDSIAGSRVSRE